MAVIIDGNNTPTAGGVGYGDGTELAFTSAGTSGQPLVSGGASAPAFRPYTLPAADGSASQILQTNGSGVLSFATVATGFTLGTPIATTSGTTAEFTGIPATAKVVFVNLQGFSFDIGDQLRMQLGTASAYVTTGYIGGAANVRSGNVCTVTNGGTSSFLLTLVGSPVASTTYNGGLTLTLLDSSTNIWCLQGTIWANNLNQMINIAGYITLTDALTRIKFIPNSSGIFDAGSINISYS